MKNNRGRKQGSKINKIYSKEERDVKFLEFLNWLLREMNMDEINEVTEFKSVNRDKIANVDHIDNIEWENILIPTFNKTEIKYGHRKLIKSYFMTIIRKITEKLGYTLSKKIINSI
jgi:hypothetical protein